MTSSTVSPASSAVTSARCRGLQITSGSPQAQVGQGVGGEPGLVAADVGQLQVGAAGVTARDLTIRSRRDAVAAGGAVQQSHPRLCRTPLTVVRMLGWNGVTRVLAVANQKGGVAKTTTVASLGAAMAEEGRRVLLVDLDPQGCLTFSLGQDPDKLAVSIHEVLLGDVEPNAALVATSEGMTLLPANIDLAGAEAMLLMRAGREYALKRALAKVAADFDVVIIDCPPSLGVLTLNGLTAADDVIVPLQCETLAHRGVGQFLRTVDDVQQITNADLKMLGALPTLYDSRTTHSRDVLLDVADRYGLVGAGPAHSAHGAVRRGQRLGCVGSDGAEEQGLHRLSGTGQVAAQALEDGQGAADLHPRGVAGGSLGQGHQGGAALFQQRSCPRRRVPPDRAAAGGISSM